TANGGNVTGRAQFDSILDGNGSTANITSASATFEARNAIGSSGDALELNVGELSTKVTTAGGGTYAANTGTLTSLAVETNSGPVVFTLAGGSLSFVQPTTSSQLSFTGPGVSSFFFNNTGGKLALAVINAGSGEVSLTAK